MDKGNEKGRRKLDEKIFSWKILTRNIKKRRGKRFNDYIALSFDYYFY